MSREKRLKNHKKEKPVKEDSVAKIEKADKSNKKISGINIRERNDLSYKQKVTIDAMTHENTNCVFIDGTWGVGKSYMAVLSALKCLKNGDATKIVYSRLPVESTTSGKAYGFLPGDLNSKQAPYMAPFFEKLNELLYKPDIDALTKQEFFEFVPPNFMQGRSFLDTVIIVDECSNLPLPDFLMILSRVGLGSRVFFIGDDFQCYVKSSGFRKIFNMFKNENGRENENGVYCFEFKDKSDIVRNGFIRYAMEVTGVLDFDKKD